MKVLVTEIGSASSGDEAICLATARRLIEMGVDVTFCYRVSLDEPLKRAGLDIRGVHVPLNETFEGINSSKELINEFAERRPKTFQELRNLLLEHDAVFIAPGGKFTDGLNTPRTLLTSAIALSLGLPVVILHQSVGPITNPSHKKLLVEIFSRCDMSLIRDDRSLNFLIDLGIPSEKLVRCKDVAMAEEYPHPSDPEYDLGINIRLGFTGHVNLDVLKLFIFRYKEKNPEKDIFIYSTTWNLPREAIEIFSSLPCRFNATMPSYPDYLKEIGRCSINISDSHHGVIFSMMADRPTICCQTGLRTWKLEGIHDPDNEPLKIFPDFTEERYINMIIEYLSAIEHNPMPLLEQQRQIIKYGKRLAEEGWDRVKRFLRTVCN